MRPRGKGDHDHALAVMSDCRTCGMPAGVRCVSSTGGELTNHHAYRRNHATDMAKMAIRVLAGLPPVWWENEAATRRTG